MDGHFFPLECSSGCESGWTMYLDQSCGEFNSVSSKRTGFNGRFIEEEKERDGGFDEEREEKGAAEGGKEKEEDLSMVSDASSGPPQFHEEEDYCDEIGCFFSSSAALMKKNIKRRRNRAEEEAKYSSFLDDTASSHNLSFSENSFNVTTKQPSIEKVLDFSMGFSKTHFKVSREEGRRNKTR